jgi:hypothetical protein
MNAITYPIPAVPVIEIAPPADLHLSPLNPRQDADAEAKVGGAPVGAKAEFVPVLAETGSGNRAARDRGHPVEAAEQPGFVQPDQRPEMEDHRPIASAGKAERDAVRSLLSSSFMAPPDSSAEVSWIFSG